MLALPTASEDREQGVVGSPQTHNLPSWESRGGLGSMRHWISGFKLVPQGAVTTSTPVISAYIHSSKSPRLGSQIRRVIGMHTILEAIHSKRVVPSPLALPNKVLRPNPRARVAKLAIDILLRDKTNHK